MKISSSIVRYLFPGILLILFVWLTFPKAQKIIQEHLSNELSFTSPLLLIALVVGVFVHQLYLPFYSFVFTRLQDKFRKKSDNYRTFLSKKYKITRSDAGHFFTFLRDKYFNQFYSEKMEMTCAILHFFYLKFLLSIIFILINIYLLQKSNIIILVVCGLFGISFGFLIDRRYEDRELYFVKSIDNSDLDKSYRQYFLHKEAPDPIDRNYWKNKGTEKTVLLADKILEISKSFLPAAEFSYNKSYIGFWIDGRACNFAVCRPQKKALRLELRLPQTDETEEVISSSGLDFLNYNERQGRYSLTLTEKDISEKEDTLSSLLKQAYANSANRVTG